MNKILISWVATNNDFTENHVNYNGPTFRFHQNFYKGYQKHILLTTEGDKPEYPLGLQLSSSLRKEFRERNIELISTDISKSGVVDFNRLHSILYPILLTNKDFEIDIFVSPGTATMQVVWHFLHMEMGLKTRLLQTIKPEDSTTGKPQLVEIQLRNSPLAEFLIVKESQIPTDKQVDILNEYSITDGIRPVYDLAREIALTQKTTVLIQGETGTGKEHLAQEIHKLSSRKDKPFITVNCAAIASDLLESRLFGFEKGAFTGALKNTPGYFHAANSGTLFLDEIGDINGQMQIALLRALQEGEVQKIGSNLTEKVDVRVIAATNKDLYDECQKGNFRWDLYYRLCVADIQLPSLKERGSNDIEHMINFFNILIHRGLENKRKPITFTANTMKKLLAHSWPGNIRELRNFIERCYAYGLDSVEPKHLTRAFVQNDSLSPKLSNVVQKHIQKIVDQCSGNLSQAREILGLGSVNTVKKYLINQGDFRA